MPRVIQVLLAVIKQGMLMAAGRGHSKARLFQSSLITSLVLLM